VNTEHAFEALSLNQPFPNHRSTLTNLSNRTDRSLVSRIDDDHANPHRAWQEMGESTYPHPSPVEALQAASELRPEPYSLHGSGGVLEVELVMPPQSIASLKIKTVS